MMDNGNSYGNIEVTKKKLLIAADTYYPKKDGVLVFLEKVVPYLTKDYDVTLIVPAFDEKEMKHIGNSKVIGFPVSDKIKVAGYNSTKISYKNIKQIKRLVKESDIVWSQDLALLGALSIYYGKKYKKPVFNYVHQITWEQAVDVLTLPRFIKRFLAFVIKNSVKYLYNKCDVLMVPYTELTKELNQKGIDANKVVVPLGVDINEFKPSEDKLAAKQKAGFDPKTKIIGYCGRISREKDLPTLKRAYSRVKEEYPDTALLIVGSGPDEQLGKLKDIPDVKITGFVRNVVPYLQAMDIFVMPSLTETTSLATLEAMACRLAVVTTKAGHIKDYIIHKFNGLFFGKGNDYILRRRIELLLNDMGTRHVLGVNARKTVEERFTWEKTRINVMKVLDMM